MSNLTDTRWKLDGMTVLYIPDEGLYKSAEDAANDKEFISRMEGLCILIMKQVCFILYCAQAP